MSNEGFVKKWHPAFLVEESGCVRYNNVVGHENRPKKACGRKGKKMTDLQKELLKLLKEIDGICRENGIEYYLAAGTVLGAVRHHGFLPWDDDADIYMTKENWEKFYRLKDRLPADRALVSMDEDFSCGFTVNRYVDVSTTRLYRYLTVNPQPAGMIVDIFVLDRLPDDPAVIEAYLKDLTTFAICGVDATQHTHRTPFHIDAAELYQREEEVGRDALLTELWEKTMSHIDPSGTVLVQRDPTAPHVWPADCFGKPRYVPFEDTRLPIAEHCFPHLAIMFDDDWMYVPASPEREEHMKTVILDISNNNAYEDYQNTVDFEKARQDCIRANRFNNLIGEANKEQVRLRLQMTAAKVRLSYQKKEWTGEELLKMLQERKHAELDAFFAEYQSIQCSRSMIGNVAVSNWERRKDPIYLEIDDEFLYVFLRNLMHRGPLGKARRVLQARAAKGELSPRLAELQDLMDIIAESAALMECCGFDQVRENLKAAREAYPENKQLLHLWFGNEYYLCDSEEDLNALLKEINNLSREDMMDEVVQTVRAHILWQLGLNDRSLAVLRAAVDETSHGLVLQSIRTLASRFSGSVIAQEVEMLAAYHLGESVELPKSLERNAKAENEDDGEQE